MVFLRPYFHTTFDLSRKRILDNIQRNLKEIMAYPDVHVKNSTPYQVINGKVNYASAFCSDDRFQISPNGDWSNRRGVCLITQVYATVVYNGREVRATPYSSSGTSYSEYAILETSPGAFAITRMVTGVEDSDVGVLEAEPTEFQK